MECMLKALSYIIYRFIISQLFLPLMTDEEAFQDGCPGHYP